jgi:hypothetical protein
LETVLYGAVGIDPALPLPDAVVAMFEGTVTVVTPGVPSYNAATDTLTVPATVGVTYLVDGVPTAAGPLVITENKIVEARPNQGYVLDPEADNDWLITFS